MRQAAALASGTATASGRRQRKPLFRRRRFSLLPGRKAGIHLKLTRRGRTLVRRRNRIRTVVEVRMRIDGRSLAVQRRPVTVRVKPRRGRA